MGYLSLIHSIRSGSDAAPVQAYGARACLVFRRRGDTFVVRKSAGYSSRPSYSFFEKEDILSELFDSGCVNAGSEESRLDGTDLWLAVDDPGDPVWLVAAEFPSGAAVDSSVLRIALAAESATIMEAGSGSLPLWLQDSLGSVGDLSGYALVVSEPRGGRRAFIDALIRKFLPDAHISDFHPNRLSQAVQLRELFGDQAGGRLGDLPVVPLTKRGLDVIVVREAGDLSQGAQLRILAELSSGEAGPVWVFETCRDLEAMTEEGLFERALLRLLQSKRIVLPPLRMVRDFLPAEVDRILDRLQLKYRREVEISDDAMEKIVSLQWPGNHEQLESTLEATFLLADSGVIRADQIRPELWFDGEIDELNLRQRSEQMETSLLLKAYALHGGNQVHMAKALGISRGSLQYRMARLGLDRGSDG